MFTCRLSHFAVLLSVGLLLTGCSDPNMPNLSPVSGQIMMDGAPVPKARIVFQPENGPSCVAEADEQGNYEIMFDKYTPGAVIGMNTVSISTHRFARENGELVEHKETIPHKYNMQTELKFDVVAGETHTKNWELTSK